MRNFFQPVAGPPWLPQVLNSIRAALSDIWPTPLRLKEYATVDLPAAADFAQGLAYNLTSLRITYSDGSSWVELMPYDTTLAALAALDATPGILVQTAADTFTKRTLTQPAAGITITNPAGTAANPIFALANDLAAVEGLAANGMVARTATDTWAVRTLAGTANRLTVTNGDGVAGAPTFDISSAYVGQATITTLGTIGTGTWQGTAITASFGGTGLSTYAIGDILFASATNALSRLADVATGNVLISGGVGVAPSWGKVDLTAHVTGDLPFANLAQGSARSVLAVAGNATADFASLQGTANQFLGINAAGTVLAFQTMTGDATLSAGAITLATVNTNTGAWGSATQSPQITLDAKGRATAAANVTITPAVGSITGLGTGVATFLATPSSANLLAALTTSTGTGNNVFSISPAFTGTASFVALSSTGQLTVWDTLTDTAVKILVRGTAKGVRIGTTAGAGAIEGVDNTGSASYQPLILGGTTVTVQSSGSTIGAFSSTGLAITGAASATGILTLSGSNSFGSALTNTAILYRDAGFGLVVAGVGSTYDLLLANRAGSIVMSVATGGTAAAFGGNISAVNGALSGTLGVQGGVPASVFSLVNGTGSADTRAQFYNNSAYAVALTRGAGNGNVYLGATAAAAPDLLVSNNAGSLLATFSNSGAFSTTAGITINSGGLAATGNITATGFVSATGNVGTSGSFFLGANALAGASGSYHILYSPAGAAIYLGGSGDPTNYFDNTTTKIRSLGGGSIFAVIDSTGLTANGNLTASGGNVVASGIVTAGGIELGYRDIPRVTGGIERGKCNAVSAGFTVNTGSAAGSTYSVYNDSGAAVTITQGGGLTLRLHGTATTGNRTLAARGFCTIWFNSTTEAIIMGDVS